MEQLTLTKIAEHLIAKELIDPEEEQQILSAKEAESATAWYIYALIAVAAWFSTIFFLVFFFLVMFRDPESVAFGAGLFMSVIAIIVNRTQNKDSIFFSQVSLAFNVAGQILMVLGFVFQRHEIAAICLFVIVLQAIMFYLYQHPVQHFAAPMAISCALFFLLHDIEGRQGYLEGPQSIHIVIGLLSAATGYFWYKESSFLKHRLFHYSLYGTTLSLLVMVSFSVFTRSHNLEMWWISGLILSLALLLLEFVLLGSLAKTTMGISILSASLLFCAMALHSPGLIAAMFTLLLGFYRGHKLLMLLSFIFLGGFLFFFYYDLEMTLLNKSLILMGSGALLIILSLVVNRTKLEVQNA
ncbi:DUF4401 domain-containing protein [Candidatus Uabimicrobium amorphum]|uniref:DUF4401 domain-containing protein n=1 Tax=Uabimicrobium amorphum TaxID=2596890 RepID=A0A5S9IK73_UABAM|nr:DUF4401 domain-containing protein [Candidatus Uabimicrobium amorphum]BBM82105.1 hypothetical protein UABAM_00448 [Candidatus Uabimicrobium amorphum]